MKVGKITIGILIVIMMLAIYINANVLYGVYAEKVKVVLTAYLLFYAVVIASFGRGLPSMNLDIMALRNFALMFVFTTLVLVPVGFLIGGATGAVNTAEVTVVLASGFGMLHFIKAFIEETVWADILKKRAGPWVSVVTFGLFHLAVTYSVGGINYGAIAVLMVLRYVWDMVYDRYGVMGSTGSHFAYNAMVMGMKIL